MEKILTIDEPRMRKNLLMASKYWAELTGASIKLISVIDESVVRNTTRTIGAVGKVSSAVADDFIRERKEDIGSILNKIGFVPQKGIDVKVGNPIEEIKKALDSFSPDLVVMGHGLKAGVINITDEIIGYTKGNCFVITETFTPPLFKRIILAIDKPEGDRYAIETSLMFAQRFKGMLYIAMVIDLNDQIFINAPDIVENDYASARQTLEDVVDKARKKGVTVEAFLKEGEVSNVISNISVIIKPDIIILGGYSRTGLNRILMGSEVGSLIKKVHCPLLIVKQKLTI